ncbi:MAG: hypothetical protein ACKODX_01070 [Gemmata sp.]
MARIRVTIDTEDVYKRAFNAAANLAGMSIQELFEQWVRENCADELERAQASIDREAQRAAGDETRPKKPKGMK